MLLILSFLCLLLLLSTKVNEEPEYHFHCFYRHELCTTSVWRSRWTQRHWEGWTPYRGQQRHQRRQWVPSKLHHFWFQFWAKASIFESAFGPKSRNQGNFDKKLHMSTHKNAKNTQKKMKFDFSALNLKFFAPDRNLPPRQISGILVTQRQILPASQSAGTLWTWSLRNCQNICEGMSSCQSCSSLSSLHSSSSWRIVGWKRELHWKETLGLYCPWELLTLSCSSLPGPKTWMCPEHNNPTVHPHLEIQTLRYCQNSKKNGPVLFFGSRRLCMKNSVLSTKSAADT